MSAKLPISILILTYNEERRLPACLASVADCNDVVVLDSGSQDRTHTVARAAGARVIEHPFSNFADQRNHAHIAARFRHPWVFHLDADETMTPGLLEECCRIAESNPPLDGFFVAPRMIYNGRWLRYCTDYPAWQARFVRSEVFRFIQVGHGQREAPDMRMGWMSQSYDHDISISSTAEWELKHRRYAREEAREIASQDIRIERLLAQILRGNALERRRGIKLASHRLPARPFLRFVYQYFFKRGFLDGPEAWGYCRYLARYEAFTSEELKKLVRKP